MGDLRPVTLSQSLEGGNGKSPPPPALKKKLVKKIAVTGPYNHQKLTLTQRHDRQFGVVIEVPG